MEEKQTNTGKSSTHVLPSSRKKKKKSDFVIYSCLLLKNSGFKEKTIKGQKALTVLGETEIVNEMYNFAIIMFLVLS